MNTSNSSIEKKIEEIKKIFFDLSPEKKIEHIIALGRSLKPYPSELKIPLHLVPGCQSLLYLSSRFDNGKIYFDAQSDALISAGLAALLIFVYSGETPETILKTPPSFLSELGILHSLTPSRSNGLAHIHQRIKKDALKYLVLTNN